MQIENYLSGEVYEMKDPHSGKPIAYFKTQVERMPEEVFNKNRHNMVYSNTNNTWLYLVKKVTREECIELYGPITNEEYGIRGGWKSVTFGKTKFVSDYLRP